jgi:hypothetical protein
LNNLFKNKKVLFVFGDPAGAKALLAFSDLHKNNFHSALSISNKQHAFFKEFDTEVEIVSNDTNTLTELINSINPNIIFTSTSYPIGIEFNCIKIAKKIKGITTISFVDHWTNFIIRYTNDDNIILPDKIFVIDKVAEKNACDEGIPSNILTVIGNPYHAYLKKWLPKSLKVDIKKLIFDQAKYLLFAPEPLSVFKLEKKYGFDEFQVLLLIINTLSELENEEGYHSPVLVFKCHPNHDVEDVKNKIQDLFPKEQADKVVVLSDANINLNELIYYSESVLGIFSNSLVEASIIGKRTAQILVLLEDKNLNPLLHIVNLDVVKTKKQLIQFLKKC